MDNSVLAIGLLLAFIGVVWAAMVLWGLICPPVEPVSERRRDDQPQPKSSSAPVAQQSGAAGYPVVLMPEAPAISAVALPDDEKIVSLSEWRERRESTG